MRNEERLNRFWLLVLARRNRAEIDNLISTLVALKFLYDVFQDLLGSPIPYL